MSLSYDAVVAESFARHMEGLREPGALERFAEETVDDMALTLGFPPSILQSEGLVSGEQARSLMVAAIAMAVPRFCALVLDEKP